MSAAERAAKYLIFAALFASFLFIGWRIATKGDYVEHEKAQCEAFAVSAALTAADALLENEALARLAAELKKAEFAADHMKMPGNNVISVTISADGDDFIIKSKAASGWNSRSPQSAEFELRLTPGGISYGSEVDRNRAARVIAAGKSAVKPDKAKEQIFTFPHERPCPAPFTAIPAKTRELSEEAVFVLIPER